MFGYFLRLLEKLGFRIISGKAIIRNNSLTGYGRGTIDYPGDLRFYDCLSDTSIE